MIILINNLVLLGDNLAEIKGIFCRIICYLKSDGIVGSYSKNYLYTQYYFMNHYDILSPYLTYIWDIKRNIIIFLIYFESLQLPEKDGSTVHFILY